MSAAPVAEPTATTSEPTIDDLFAAAADELTTRTSEPERASATPDDAPVSEPAADGEGASADTPQAGPERDESGRFKPKEGESQEAGKEPAEAAKPAEQPEDWRAVAEKAQRDLAAVRGNVDNAARQAAEKARQEERAQAQAQAKQSAREEVRAAIQEQINSGELSYEAGSAIYARKQQEWAQADQQEERARREEADNTRRAGLMLSEVETDGQQKLLTLYQHGAQVLAEDTGLTVDEVRGLWAEPEERQRFLRASMQAHMAAKLPGAGFNREALNDYMATKVEEGRRIATIKKSHSAEVATLRKEIDRLTQQLNRQEADSDALRPETPARGSGPRRKEPTTMEEAGQELTRRLAADMTRS